MCLEIVESTERARKRKGFGWKVFNVNNGMLVSENYGRLKRVGVWLRSRDNKSEDYPLGFHVFRTRREARHWTWAGQKVRKVMWRDFLANGTQEYMGLDLRIIVAKEMMIL